MVVVRVVIGLVGCGLFREHVAGGNKQYHVLLLLAGRQVGRYLQVRE